MDSNLTDSVPQLAGFFFGHQSLGIFVRFTPNLPSAVDPVSLVRKLTSFRLAVRYASNAVCLL